MENGSVYSDWRYVINGKNQKELYGCSICQSSVAALQRRYVTDSNEERYEQFRVHCPVCETNGKVYRNKNVAVQSWIGREHIKRQETPPPKRRGSNA